MALALVVLVQVSDVLSRFDESEPELPVAEETSDVNPIGIAPTVFTFIDEFVQDGQKKLRLNGTGEPNTVIVILDAGERQRQIRSDASGAWSVIIDAIDERPMVLEAVSFNATGITIRGDETVYRIVMPEALRKKNEEGESLRSASEAIALDIEGLAIENDAISDTPVKPTLIMVTAPGGPSRVVRSPFGGMPTTGPLTMGPIDFDDTGGVIFSGVTSEEGRVRLYANDSAIGETRVGAGGRWNFIAGRMLPRGEYDVRAELIRVNGPPVNVSVPFEFQPTQDRVEGPMPFVRFEPFRWVVRRELLGGGIQSAVIFAPIEAEPLIPEVQKTPNEG